MKLITYKTALGPRAGIWTDDGVIDIASLNAALPADMLSIIEAGDDAVSALQRLDLSSAERHRVDASALCQPIVRPPKILAIALNYTEHVKESLTEPPPVQMWFNKQSTCATGPYDPIDLPVVSDKLDYEGELGVVIGKRCRHVPADRAMEVIFGYTVVNDLSVRDWQRAAQTFQIGKSFDTHGPFGPWIETKDEIEDPQNLELRTLVNGELRQSANTGLMIHPIAQQIEHLTKAITLEPGDLLVTGTPSGVGAAMEPPCFLKDGDVVRVEIDGIGAIENRVRKEVLQTVIA